jgi:hypothetical protein
MTMNPTLKKVLIGTGITIVLLPLLAVGLAWALEGKIKQRIVEEINKQVTVPVKVEGDINLSLLKYFPNASLTFKKVSIDDKLHKGKGKMADVGEISFLCDIYSLFGDKIKFNSIVIKNGSINLYRDAYGNNNFDILKPTDNKTPANTQIQITKARIENIKLTFTDKLKNTQLAGKVADLTLKGNFGAESFDVATLGNFSIQKLVSNDETLIADRNFKTEIVLSVDQHGKRFLIKKGTLAVDENEFNIEGTVLVDKNASMVNLQAHCKGDNINTLTGLLPAAYRERFANTEGSGRYNVDAEMKGLWGKGVLPKLTLSATLDEGELKLSSLNKQLKQVFAEVKYELLPDGRDKLVIKDFKCTLNNEPFHFTLALTHLSNPAFDFRADGVLHLEEIKVLIPDTVMQDLDGTITFRNFHLQGKKDDFTDPFHSSMIGEGQFDLAGIEFRQGGITYGNINGNLTYRNEAIDARNLTFNFLSTDFTFNGSMRNVIAFAYSLGKFRQNKNVVLMADGKVKINRFHLTNILNAFPKKANKPSESRINASEIMNMQGHLQLEIGEFIFREMHFNNIVADLDMHPGVIGINHLSTNTMGGSIKVIGDVGFPADNSLKLNCNIQATNLELPKIFKECENFGQETLTDKNLKGKINTNLSLDARWVNMKDLDMKNLNALVDFTIQQGELINFEPIKAAGKFIRMDELMDIKFSDLSNVLHIKNEKIDIPAMEIKSNALNLVIMGTHGFDNVVDYHFKINLRKLLAQKFDRRANNAEYIETDAYEGVNIFLTMKGNLSNPEIKFDKPGAKDKMKADIAAEREELKNLFSNKPVKKDENETKREDKYFKIEEQPQFIDFDEEDK